ncbi:hypothetical protein KKG58_02245 [Patescibacteria group bacterium]|nr:hypothetical protein [Patescibacteria group bacterium]
MPTKWLSFMHWSGWSAGEPEEPAIEINDFFVLNAVYLSIWKVQLRHTRMDFLGDAFSMPGVSLTVPIPMKKIKISVAADYDLTTDEPYYNIGVSYTR